MVGHDGRPPRAIICVGALTPLWEHWLPQVVSRLCQARQVAERLQPQRHPRRRPRRHGVRRVVCAAPRMPPHGTPRQPAAAREAAGALAQRAGVPPTLAAQRQRRQRRARQRSRRACHARGWVGCACAMHSADRWAPCSCCAGTAGTARRRSQTASAAGGSTIACARPGASARVLFCCDVRMCVTR